MTYLSDHGFYQQPCAKEVEEKGNGIHTARASTT